jgi:D-alanyl-D-alanine carboxypeptidase
VVGARGRTVGVAAEQLVDYARNQPALFPAGSEFHYSNTNTVLLGMVLEKVTGRPVAEVFKSHLFEPLGLSGTSFAGSPPICRNRT